MRRPLTEERDRTKRSAVSLAVADRMTRGCRTRVADRTGVADLRDCGATRQLGRSAELRREQLVQCDLAVGWSASYVDLPTAAAIVDPSGAGSRLARLARLGIGSDWKGAFISNHVGVRREDVLIRNPAGVLRLVLLSPGDQIWLIGASLPLTTLGGLAGEPLARVISLPFSCPSHLLIEQASMVDDGSCAPFIRICLSGWHLGIWASRTTELARTPEG